MRLLLDTHAFFWFTEKSARLPGSIHDEIADPENRVWLSIVSVWEIAIKVNVGTLDFPQPLAETVRGELRFNRIESLPIALSHLGEYIALPLHHRDPFDRLPVAQARAEELTLVSRDPALRAYDIDLL